ncbi:MAG TPA: glycoside hydrolase family 43 protein [Acidobacteriaceae bacterium]|nr:glycoside hydrolase family 43 protein [Acidobacteriaceae bacterium]
MTVRKILSILLLLALASAGAAQAPAPTDPIVFAYFKEPGNQGIYLALSRDGYTFTPLNDGQPWLKPDQPGEIMRDVYITRTPDGAHFRMVFTWAWHGNAIGISDSDDLVHWSPQRRIEIMSAFPNVQNTWAPETYWDAQTKDWLIIFSSNFKATATAPAEGLRIWSAHTADWQTFTKPEKFFDRGFPAIDATMFDRDLHGKRDVVMVLKDQTTDPLRYNERWTSAPTVNGPWGPLSAPINEPWSEGPSVIQVGDKFIVYYDHYRPPNPRYKGVETTDWIHWTSVDDKMHFPEAAKHGSFFRVTEEEAQRLLARHDPTPADASAP